MSSEEKTQQMSEYLLSRGWTHRPGETSLFEPGQPAEWTNPRGTVVRGTTAQIADATRKAEQPQHQTGRAPTGRLRNFRAMSLEKLEATKDAVKAESNDEAAAEAIEAEVWRRIVAIAAELRAA